MVRTRAPLVERMTLVLHDWFATSVASVPPDLLLDQDRTIRQHALGRFGDLFTLGAGRGYTERDVREAARALTGFRSDWVDGRVTHFRLDPAAHDDGIKTIFGHRGRYGWKDAVRLAVAHPKHPAYAVRRLWDHFVPVAPPARDAAALARLYRASGGQVRPVVAAILRHPALHTGPRMVKPPVVYVAGLLRAVGRGVDTDAWSWLCGLTGQRLRQRKVAPFAVLRHDALLMLIATSPDLHTS